MYKTLRFMLVSLLMMLCGTVFAQDETIDFSALDYANAEEVATVKGTDVTLTLDKGTNNNTPKYYNTGTALRLYGGNTMTVSSTKTIEKVVFTFNSTYNLNDPTVSEGSYDSDKSTWTGSASEFTITRGGTSGHARIQKMEFYFADGQTDNRQGTYMELGEHATTGVIGGSMPLPTVGVKNETGAPINNLTIAWESTNTEVATIGNGVINFNAVGTTTIKAAFAGDNTYKPCNASFNLTITEAPYTSIAAMLADITSNRTTVTYQFENLLVTYVNSNNTYVSDGQNGFLFYGSNLGLNAGEIISGSAVGQLYTYNGLPELAVSAEGITKQVVSQDNVVTWTAIAPADIQNNINVPVIIENAVYVSASGKNLTFKVGETDLAVYNNWSIDITALEADKAYTLKGIGCIFVKNETTTYQIYLDSFEEYVAPVVDNNYYILGDFWGENFEDAPQVMTQSPTAADIYTLVSKVTVEGKKYEYKLRQGDNWNGYQLPAQGNQDFVFGTEEYPAGTYTLTFTANITENTLELSVERDALDKAKAEFAALIAKIEGKYNEFKDQMPAESQQEAEAAIQAAKDAVNDPNATLESLAAAKETFMAAALKAQSDALGLDENVTDKFDIELNWISEMGAVTDYKNGNENLKEVWLDTTTDTGKVIHKTVEKLENGTYEVKLIGGALFTGNGETAALQSDEEGRVVIYANNVALSIPVKFAQDGNTQHYELKNVVVSDGKMEIGMEKLAPGSNRHFIQIEKVKMLSNTRQVADEEGQNNHWQGIAQTILGYEAYNTVTGEPREALAAAETKEAVMAAIPVFYASVPEVVEPTAIYSVAGEPSELFGAYWNEKATETEMTLNNEGLYEWRKENVTLAGGVSVQFKVVKNHDWSVSYPANNYVSEIQEDGVYNVVITFNDKTEEVNAEIVKVGDAVIENAEITQVELRGDFNNWSATDACTMTKGETENVWTMTLDLTNATEDQKFKLVVNNEKWIGNQQMEIDAPDKWVDSAYDQDNNLVLRHSGTNYSTYTVTATWTPNVNANEGWTLKFEGKDEKNPVVLNPYSAIFKTNADWNEVYAYTFSMDGDNVVEELGQWPGKQLSYNERYDQYELSFEAENAPQFIIFNNGIGGGRYQTENLEFVNQNTYVHNVDPDSELMAQAKALAADADAVAVGKLIAAIDWANQNNDESQLQAAIDQFKEDNAPQETDLTSQFSALTNPSKWVNAIGAKTMAYAGWAAPKVHVNGAEVALVESYDEGQEFKLKTGDVMYQDITGLTPGTYGIELFGAACLTAGRAGMTTDFAEGDDNSKIGACLYAQSGEQNVKEYISCLIESNMNNRGGEEAIPTAKLDGIVVGADGTIRVGLAKELGLTNWHFVQLKSVIAQVLAKDLYAAHQTELQALVAEAQALAADENKTEGKDAFQEALTTAELAVNSQWYNNAEIEGIINNLKNAIANFKKANYYIDFAAGEYYVIDAESGKMMAAGSSYGTRGIVNETGLDLTLTPYTESRTVTFDSRVSNGENNHFLGQNMYMDSSEWGFALEYQGFAFYILEPNSEKYINIDENDNLVLSETPREFIIVTKDGVMEQRKEELADATETNPVDATFLLQNPNFNRNDQRVSAWEWIPSETAEENADNWNNHNFNGGNEVNNCAESYHAAFVVKQTVSDAPAGKYTMTAQGFYRQDAFDGDAPAAPMFFANGVNKDVPALTGSENSMKTASESFTSGLYTIEPIEFEVAEDGMIYVGVTAAVHNQWVIFDNFQLKYYGKKDITDGISVIETEILNGNVYNLQGQKVTKAQKGLYIVNGRKMIQK